MIWSWNTGRWFVACYIWYSEEGTGPVYRSPYCRMMFRCSAVLMCPVSSPLSLLGFLLPLYALVSIAWITRRPLGRAHVPPTKVFRRLSEQNHFKTTPRSSGAPPVGFSRRKIPRSSALYDIGESNPVPASGLWSGSGSKVNQFVHVPIFVDTQHFIQIHARVFE